MTAAAAAALPAPPRTLDDGVVELRLLAPADAAAVAAAVPPGEPGAWEPTPGPYSVDKARALIARWDQGRRRGERLSLAVLAAGRAPATGATPAEALLGAVVFERGAPAARERPDVPGQLECGYWIRPGERGRGYAARAVRLAVSWALGLPAVRRVWLEIERPNTASRHIAERAGFALCGVQWRALGGDPVPGDVLIYERCG